MDVQGRLLGMDTEREVLRPELATVMVAGRPRHGKSNALNNIFGLDLAARTSTSSVTRVVSTFEATKTITMSDWSSREAIMQVIDTPGLGALDIPKEEILKDMKRVTDGVNFILLYCFSVSPNNSLIEMDKTIITNLHQALGEEVWSKCVLLLTFSDHAWMEFEDCPAEYVHHINHHAQGFQKLLQDTFGKEIYVKSIFEYESKILSEEENPSNIIAVPGGKKITGSEYILPGIIQSREDWTDVVFVELMKRTDSTQRMPFVIFKYPKMFFRREMVAGIAIGAIAGGIFGGPLGPLGLVAGVAAGSAIGGATVSAIGGIVGSGTLATRVARLNLGTRAAADTLGGATGLTMKKLKELVGYVKR